MLSSILRSASAIQVNIAIMRAFVASRKAMAANKALAARLKELEHRVGGHDHKIDSILDAIQRLVETPDDPPKKIGGFRPSE